MNAEHAELLKRIFGRAELLPRLEQSLREAGERGNAVALLLVKLRDLRQINKLYGFAGGDAVLAKLVHGLAKSKRDREKPAGAVSRQGLVDPRQ